MIWAQNSFRSECKEFACLRETCKMSHTQTALGGVMQSVTPFLTTTLPTCLVLKTTRGVWLLGLSATTLMGSNTMWVDRNMRAEEGDCNVICLETSSSQNKPQCSSGVLWQRASSEETAAFKGLTSRREDDTEAETLTLKFPIGV